MPMRASRHTFHPISMDWFKMDSGKKTTTNLHISWTNQRFHVGSALWKIHIDTEHNSFFVETNLPTPICQGLC